MPEPSNPPRPEAVALIRRAAELDAHGASCEAVDAWTRAVEQAPDFLPALLALAQAQIRMGRPAEAIASLERGGAGTPDHPALWLALAVARSTLSLHDDAVAAAERAAALVPNHAAVQLGLGDVRRQARRPREALDAYARAVELEPGNVDALNRLATMHRATADIRNAEAVIERALALDPRHPYVRVNAGTLAMQYGDRERGRRLLAEALDDPRLPADARREAREALAMVDEAAEIEGPVALALSSGGPEPILSALRVRRRGTARDEQLIAFFGRVVDRNAGRTDAAARFARGCPRSTAWGAIEAHHHYLETRSREAIAATLGLLATPDRPRTQAEQDVEHYARAVDAAGGRRFDEPDPIAFEALMRWTHAQLVRHRPDRKPGCFKLGGFQRLEMRGLSHRYPAFTQATLDAVVREFLPRLPEGPVRAAFLHVAVVTLQPFADCNTRVARLLQNRLLEHAGYFPSLRPPSGDRDLLTAVLATADLEPLLASLAAGSHEASQRDREWAAHGAH